LITTWLEGLPVVEETCTLWQNESMDADELNEQRAPYGAGADATIPAEWLAEFEAAARRSLETRFRYAFIHTHKPVLDDAPFRAFSTTADYRRWCEENLPDWLGYGRV
jgi:hypothetical protein